MHEVAVIGLMRSGLHAVWNWLGLQLPGVAGINDARCQLWATKTEEERACDPAATTLIYTVEDETSLEVENLRTLRDGSPQPLPVGLTEPKWVVVLRDPLNTFASRLAYRGGDLHLGDGLSKRALEAWKRLAMYHILEPRGVVTVNYDRWHESRAYREATASEMGLDFSDVGRNYIWDTGYGSSFDGLDAQNNAGAMKTGERYKRFLRHPGFLEFFDDQTRALTERIFGGWPEDAT